jgi:hypothetical protein
MAFLAPHFEYDVFVSYSHGVRTRQTEPPLKAWTLKLIEDLEADVLELGKEFDDLHIWRDVQIDPTMHLTEELRRKVNRSGILLIVMSPRYLDSDWCKDELEWFRQQVQDRARDQGRVFVVRALHTDEKLWPEFLRDDRGHGMPGFWFHHKDSMPFNWRGATDHEAYVQELGRLQIALARRLRDLRQNAERRKASEVPKIVASSGGQRRIYLHARPEYASTYDEVSRILTQDGIAPLTASANPSHNMAGWRQESLMRFETAKCCDALALVRADGDARFVGDLLEIGVDERGRIENSRGAPLPCAVLDRSGQSLPVDVSKFGIERFDLANDNWRGHFHGWLERFRGQPVGAL